MTDRRIRVLVVDDSAFARKVVREVLERDARFEVVGIARDGIDGLEKIADLQPDVVTLDLVMPNLDGIGVLRSLATLASARSPRVVVVSMSENDSDLVIRALEMGAVDFVHKPTALATDRLFELADELVAKVAAAASAGSRRGPPPSSSRVAAAAAAPAGSRSISPSSRRLVAIGASTGGPQALTLLLGQLPRDFPAPVAVALHMPIGYTEALARRLDQACAVEVVEASEGVELRPGRVVIARAGMHLKVDVRDPSRGRLDILPLHKPHRPSVDVLFESAAAALGNACIGVVLTGMGDDGLIGARALRAAGATVLTEAESSCVVYGMPRSVMEAGLADGEAPLDAMFEAIRARL